MGEAFLLTVDYKNQERHFDAELRVFGYTHKIAVLVNGVEIIFEPDEERNYRAVFPGSDADKKNIDTALLQSITHELEKAFK